MRPWILLVLLSAALSACQGSESGPSTSAPAASPNPPESGGHVSGAQARALVSDEGATLLDVRSVAEYAAGHVEGAKNIPVQELEARMGEVPTSTPVVVYCQSGGRSAAAARMLRTAGYETYDLGPMAAW